MSSGGVPNLKRVKGFLLPWIAIDSFVHAFLELFISLEYYQFRMVVGSLGSLYTMVWPHDLHLAHLTCFTPLGRVISENSFSSGWLEAKETWSAGWKSLVRIILSKIGFFLSWLMSSIIWGKKVHLPLQSQGRRESLLSRSHSRRLQ